MRKIAVDRAVPGRRVKCPRCGQVLTVPQSFVRQPAGRPPAGRAAPSKPTAVATLAAWPRSYRIGIGVLLVVALLALIFGNLVTRLFVGLVVLSMLNGYWLGASNLAAGIAGTLAALLFAVPVGRALEGWSSMLFGSTGLVNRVVSIAVGGVILGVVVGLALSVPVRRAVKSSVVWRRFDKLLGTGLGLLEGALLGTVLIWAAVSVEPMAARALAEGSRPERGVQASPSAEWVVTIAKAARNSAVGRAASVVNPLKELRVIDLLERVQTVLNDPVARELFVNHPAIQRIRHRPSVERTLALLSAEPQIPKLEDGISHEEVRSLLTSPRFLAILDETGLLGDLSPIANDVEADPERDDRGSQSGRSAVHHRPAGRQSRASPRSSGTTS
jgi:hypothetical protein